MLAISMLGLGIRKRMTNEQFERELCFKRWEEIVDEMGYSLHRLYELHNLALEQISFKVRTKSDDERGLFAF